MQLTPINTQLKRRIIYDGRRDGCSCCGYRRKSNNLFLYYKVIEGKEQAIGGLYCSIRCFRSDNGDERE
jgi:hypothetical protein